VSDAAEPLSLAEQFSGRRLRTQVVLLPLDPDEYDRIERELAGARWALEDARSRGMVDTAALRAAVDALQVELEAQPVLQVRLTALPADEWEDLVDAHPPTEADEARGYQWDPKSLRPPLLARSVVVPPGVAAPDWEHLAKSGEIGAGELEALYAAAVMLNVRGLSAAVGKGR
jgi:hypothetical protein